MRVLRERLKLEDGNTLNLESRRLDATTIRSLKP